MQILKGKKERMPEINQYAGEQSSSNQTVISLDKWVDNAKANKAAYEAGKESIEVIEKNIKDYYIEQTEWVANNFPVNLIQYSHPHLVLKSDKLEWNKEALYLLLRSDWSVYQKFIRHVGNELMEFIGLSKEEQERLMISNFWVYDELIDFAVRKFNEGDY